MEHHIKEQMELLEQQKNQFEKKRLKEQKELELVKKNYVRKLNKEFSKEYKNLKYKYETRLKKHKRLLYDEITSDKWVSSKGANPYLQELETELQGLFDEPVMISDKKTKKKIRYKTDNIRSGKDRTGKEKTKRKRYKMEDGVQFIKQEIRNNQ